MTKRNAEEHSLSSILKEFIEKNKLQSGLDKVSAAEAWKNLMGNGINNYTQSVELKKNTLYVTLTSSILREELSYGKTKIIKMLNDELGKNVISEIVLR